MTVSVTETQQRFLRAIVEQVPVERIVEVHLFPSLRQGQAESGVAVIAALPDNPVAASFPVAASRQPVAGSDTGDVSDDAEIEAQLDSEQAEVLAEAEAEGMTVEAGDTPDAERQTPDAAVRHVVYSARYRLVVKGPARGTWDCQVTAEADAPLVTVEMVVRGVQQRAGEEAEPERLTAEGLRHALEEIAWAQPR